jgi:Subtilase family
MTYYSAPMTRNIWVRLLAVVFTCLGCSYAISQNTSWRGEVKERELDAITKLLLTQAIAHNYKDISLLIASNRGETAEAEQLVREAGGTILKSIPEIGYIHAVAPVDRVWWLMQQPAVTDLAVAGGVMFRENLKSVVLTKTESGNNTLLGERDVDLSLSLLPPALFESEPGLNANAYLQQPQWLRAHPTWDGRGVTIVSAEGMPGVDHPSLQKAKDIRGKVIPKVGGVIDAVDYLWTNPTTYVARNDESAYLGEVRFSPNVRLNDGTDCPRPSNVGNKVGVWNVVHYYVRNQYCVEWDTDNKVARIDLNKDGNFTDDPPLYDFNEKHGVVKIPYAAKLGDGQPEHHFTAYLLYDDKTGTVSILPSESDHSAMTATAAAGTGFMGTEIGGMAPNSRLLFMRSGDLMSEQIEGVWKAAARPDVDVITTSTMMGGESFPSEARTVPMLFYDRISEVTGKPIVAFAGNWGLPFEEGYNRGRLVIGVGAYISDAQMRIFIHSKEALKVPFPDYVASFSSSGPSADGSLSTDILAPALGIAGSDCGSDHYATPAAQAQVGVSYRLPPCYAVSGGTSTATPRAAGALALLLSAAKQEHLRVTPEQIKNALIVSARFLPNQPAFRQGPGLLQVEEAWKALKEAARKPRVVITSSTPDLVPLYPQNVRGPLIGKSIYVTRGFHLDERNKLTLSLDVTGVATKDLSYVLLGNDGTFNITSIQNNSKGNVKITLDALAASTGNKSALLEVRAKGWIYPLTRLPILLAATPKPESLRSGITIQGRYDIVSTDFFVFEPPEGTAALEVIGNAKGSPLWVDFVTGTNPTLTYNPDHGHQETGSPILNGQRKYIVPLLRPDLVGLHIVNSETGNDPCCTTEYTFTVRALTASELLAAARDAPALVVTSQQQLHAIPVPGTPAYNVDVAIPKGTDAVVISFPQSVYNPAKPYAVEAYLYDPQGEKQGIWNYLPIVDGQARFNIPKPKAGTWKLVVLGADPGPIKLELLHQTAKEASASAEQYLAFGALCNGAECADTWPLSNPLWRFMPLLPISSQTKGVQ